MHADKGAEYVFIIDLKIVYLKKKYHFYKSYILMKILENREH